VVGIFPDDASVIRLVSMLAIEADEEWLVGRSYISRGSMTTLYETRPLWLPRQKGRRR
jgi:transposase-like protein